MFTGLGPAASFNFFFIANYKVKENPRKFDQKEKRKPKEQEPTRNVTTRSPRLLQYTCGWGVFNAVVVCYFFIYIFGFGFGPYIP